jgi:hypothetical protein
MLVRALFDGSIVLPTSILFLGDQLEALGRVHHVSSFYLRLYFTLNR